MRIICADIEKKLADPRYNAKQVIAAIRSADEQGADFLLFGELTLTGYSCGDLFFSSELIDKTAEVIPEIISVTEESDTVVIVGAPLELWGRLYDCALVIHDGEVLGIVPKTRVGGDTWPSSSKRLEVTECELWGQTIPVGKPLLFQDQNSGHVFGVVIGKDEQGPIPVSAMLSSRGAQMIFALDCDLETAVRPDERRELIKALSAMQEGIYAYCSGGRGESVTDVVYSGYKAVFNCGQVIEEDSFPYERPTLMADNTVRGRRALHQDTTWTVIFSKEQECPKTEKYSRDPFLKGSRPDTVCERISILQQEAISRRMQAMGRDKLILGVSGGLDSAVALLACVSLFKSRGMPLTNIIGVTMPGAGTSRRTLDNALSLMKELGIDGRTIPITEAVEKHLENISHPAGLYDITYEQTQSRERTKILLDLANQEHGIAVGTGDLSELALGWMSYGGDQLSMFGLNSGIPKTVMRLLIDWYIIRAEPDLRAILSDIRATPVSPELLPLDRNGVQTQSTERLVGPYELHDLFLYYLVVEGMGTKELYELGVRTFPEYDRKEILQCLRTFVTRFFTRQYKRSCFPDGIRVLDVSLSPRGGWSMPSDIDGSLWLDELEEVKL